MQQIMTYEIYHTKADYQFFGYDFAKEHGFSFNDYTKVYESTISVGDKSDEGAVAELLFMIFNSDKRPEDYKGHSMSVADIVKINKKYFYCDDIGWKELDIKD